MSKPALTRRMSAADSAFLYLERKGLPLHIASVCVFDGPISFPEFLAGLEAKLDLIPRYRQIPVIPPWSLDFPTWEDDPHFDIRRHVSHVTLALPGGEAELQELAGRILSELLDRDKPLWEVHVVDGLAGGRGALIWRVHHALADGVSGAELMKILLDPTAEAPLASRKPRSRQARRKAAEPALPDGISAAIQSTIGNLLEFEAGMLHFAEALVDNRKPSPLEGLGRLLPEFTASIERLPFNKPCTGARKFCWTEFDMVDVQTVREAIGGTVNDIILAVLTRALARYVKLHGQSVVHRFVRVVCPVNLRMPEQNNSAGNQISFLPVALPMDARGPVRMLRAVTARTETLKSCGALSFVRLAANWLSAAPPPLQALFWRSIPEVILPVPLLNLICTNVVGSATPLYAAGRRMLAAYPQVPTGWDLGVGCAVHSYNGKLFWGLVADTEAAPDVDRLRDFLVLSFEELRRSAAATKGRGSKRNAPVARRTPEQPAKPVRPAAQESTRAGYVPLAEPAPTVDPGKEAA